VVALQLLGRYFEKDDLLDRAQAHVDRATALLTLGRVEEATIAYDSALQTEENFPNVLTTTR